MVSGKSCRNRGVLIAADFVTMFATPGDSLARVATFCPFTKATELIVVSTATDAASTVTISVAVPTDSSKLICVRFVA